MERMIGLILIVTAIWVGVEFYTEGDQAFGGIFASADSSEPAAPAASGPSRAQTGEADWAGSRVKASVTKMHVDRAQRIKDRVGAD
jgi:hypothetical protein